MGNSITTVVNKILEDYENIILDATKEAAHKGQEDIMKEAKRYLQEYYNWRPKMYKRTRNLQRAMSPYSDNTVQGNTAFFTIGVEYDPDLLKGFYKSNSKWHQSGNVWKSVPDSLKIGMTKGVKFEGAQAEFFGNFGTPEPEYILGNYLEGIHGEAHMDTRSPADKLDNFFKNELPDRIEAYMQSAIVGALKSRM